MNRLQKTIYDRHHYKDEKKPKKFKMPERKRRRVSLRIKVLLLILGIFILFTYGSSFFIHETEEEQTAVEKDISMLKSYEKVLDSKPFEDFDNDGIDNATEIQIGTNPYLADTDGDGAYDYYEYAIVNGNPTKYEKKWLEAYQKEHNKTSTTAPYRIGDVVLWAKDSSSKTFGTVVQTINGYRFSNFKGYAQFPVNKYVYRVDGKDKELLKKRKDEDVWEINGDWTVETYDEPIKEVIEIKLFNKFTFHKKSNVIRRFFAKILPDESILVSSHKLPEAAIKEETISYLPDFKPSGYDKEDMDIYSANTNSLQDLQNVRKTLELEGNTVFVSLLNKEEGGFVGLVYGYTDDGLYIADCDTGEPVGWINITERARMVITQYSERGMMTYFDFKGMGFDSEKGDIINFFATNTGY